VETQFAQHVPLEPHVVRCALDPQDRLVITTSTQVPFHVRRIIAKLLDLPVHRLRVIKPRIGGGFGVKQEVLLEDLVALVTLRTGRPSSLVYTREEEFVSSRVRHPMRLRTRLGATREGDLTALDLDVLSNTGAYGTHSLTVLSNVGSKTLPLYNTPADLRFTGRAVYTNLPVGGAYRGYGATQGQFALEVAMDHLADELGMDALALRSRNHIRTGGTSPIFRELGEGREGVEQVITSCALEECIRIGAERIGWDTKRGARRRDGSWVHGVGMSIHMQGSGIPMIDMGAATIKVNDDGSVNLQVGATDLGTGSDTILAQIAAEVLGLTIDQVIVTSSDTDLTPFDVGAYASSTTYVTGTAVQRAAEDVAGQLRTIAADILRTDSDGLELVDGRIVAPDERSVSLEEVALRSLYGVRQKQPAATASAVLDTSPPPFLASFAEVAVDLDTGRIRIVDWVAAADCGTAIHPSLAAGQVEGALANGIGYALYEDLAVDDTGRARGSDLGRYKIPSALDLPRLEVVLVDSYEPTGPMGAKSIAEIGINAPLPCIANAVHDATGVWLTRSPLHPRPGLGRTAGPLTGRPEPPAGRRVGARSAGGHLDDALHAPLGVERDAAPQPVGPRLERIGPHDRVGPGADDQRRGPGRERLGITDLRLDEDVHADAAALVTAPFVTRAEDEVVVRTTLVADGEDLRPCGPAARDAERLLDQHHLVVDRHTRGSDAVVGARR
jgi:putative selenate reductase molybdopterin-binding subunit